MGLRDEQRVGACTGLGLYVALDRGETHCVSKAMSGGKRGNPRQVIDAMTMIRDS